MPEPARARRARPAPPRPSRGTLSVDLLLLTVRHGALHLLLRRAGPGTRERWECPWDGRRGSEPLEEGARRLARAALDADPSWSEQLGAFGERRHPGGADLSVAFLALAPVPGAEPRSEPAGETVWHPVAELPPLAPRQRAMLEGALRALPERLDHAPLAFHLVPELFTLSQVQQAYELLLARPLHKASFRRALLGAALVEPTREWRTEGRGRPAQLYRYAPRKRRRGRRGVRFEGM